MELLYDKENYSYDSYSSLVIIGRAVPNGHNPQKLKVIESGPSNYRGSNYFKTAAK